MDEVVAIKRVKWRHIRASQKKSSEDFINEIAALKYLSDFLDGDGMDAHILTADIVMSDESYLYLVMPYCAGGDICTRVGLTEHFRLSENESRTYFLQLLTVRCFTPNLFLRSSAANNTLTFRYSNRGWKYCSGQRYVTRTYRPKI